MAFLIGNSVGFATKCYKRGRVGKLIELDKKIG